MKILIVAIAIIGAIIYFVQKQDAEQKADFAKKWESISQKNAEEEQRRVSIGVPVNAACRAATERLVHANGAKILDWLGGRTSTGELNGQFEWFQETSTGYSKRILASVSGIRGTFTADCFTDKSFKVIDLQTFIQP